MLELGGRGSHGFFKVLGSSIRKKKGSVVNAAVANVGSANTSLICCFHLLRVHT